jgi:hypothetical protein
MFESSWQGGPIKEGQGQSPWPSLVMLIKLPHAFCLGIDIRMGEERPIKGQYRLVVSALAAAHASHIAARLQQRSNAIMVHLLGMPWVPAALVACLGTVVACVAGVLVLVMLVVPRRAHQSFSRVAGLGLTTDFELEREWLRLKTPLFDAKTPWRDFVGWWKLKDSFLLFGNTGTWRIIPDRALDSAGRAMLISRLEAAGVPKRRNFGIR